jgi:hypothetical protein
MAKPPVCLFNLACLSAPAPGACCTRSGCRRLPLPLFNHPHAQPNSAPQISPCSDFSSSFCRPSLDPDLPTSSLALLVANVRSLGALGWWVLRACARRELVQCLSVSLHPPLRPSLLLRLGLCHSPGPSCRTGTRSLRRLKASLHTCMLRYHGRSTRRSPPVNLTPAYKSE